MEAYWVAQRAALRWLVRHHPEWTQSQFASSLGCSRSFVKKWLKRLGDADPDDTLVLFSHSSARHTPPPDPALSSASSRLVPHHLRTCSVLPDHAPFFTTCTATLICRLKVLFFHAPHAPSGRSCDGWDISWTHQSGFTSHWSHVSHFKRSKWTLRISRLSHPILLANSNTSLRCSILWMLGPPSCSALNPMRISTPRRLWKPW